MALRRGYGAPGSGGDDRWDCRRRCRPWPILADLSQVDVADAARRPRRTSPAPTNAREAQNGPQATSRRSPTSSC